MKTLARIRFPRHGDAIATLDSDRVWHVEPDVPGLEDQLNTQFGHDYEFEPLTYIPYPYIEVAQAAADKLGGEIDFLREPPPGVPGRIY